MTLQEKIQKGLDCWCDRAKCVDADDCRKYGCLYADSESECSTEILWDVDILLRDIAAKDSAKAEDKQPITPDAVRRKVIEEIRDQCSTLWECEAYGDQLARDLAYIAGLVDMTNDVCKMLEGGKDAPD